MKLCPQCNRIENDEALNFCRVDGATLVNDSSSIDKEAGTVELGSRSGSSETAAGILPHATGGNINRATASTIVLPSQPAASTISQLNSPKRRRTAIVIAVVVTAAVAATSAILVNSYRSRKSSSAIQSIAVMPFVNGTGNVDVEYLSDGLTESLINSLSRLPNLSVKARSTVFRYKGRDLSPQQAGTELSVQAVLNGRVVERGDQLAVSVDLVNSGTGNQIWGQQYSGKVSDAVSLQTQIANEVSLRLQSNVSREDQARLSKGSTTNPDAYLLYLKGRYQTAKYTKEGLARGLDYFNQAIAADPGYALAYDGIADNYIAAADWYMAAREAVPKAGAAARKALEFDPQLAEAHSSLAIVHWWFDWDWPAAEAEFKRALELDPNDARAHAFYGWFLAEMGRIDAGVAESRRAVALDPLSVEVIALAAQNFYFARRYAEAVDLFRSALEIDQNYWLAHSFLGRCYEQQQKLPEATLEFQRALELEKDVPENYAMLAHAYGAAGKKKEAQKLLAALQDMAAKRHVPAYNFAIAYLGLGDKDQALSWLERAYAEHSFYITWIKCDPQLDSLRADSRLAGLVQRTGL